MSASQTEAGPSAGPSSRPEQNLFREVPPDLLEKVAQLVSEYGEKVVFVALRGANQSPVLLWADWADTHNFILETMPQVLQTESSSGDKIGNKRGAGDVMDGEGEEEEEERERRLQDGSHVKRLKVAKSHTFSLQQQLGESSTQRPEVASDDVTRQMSLDEHSNETNSQSTTTGASSDLLSSDDEFDQRRQQDSRDRIVRMGTPVRDVMEDMFGMVVENSGGDRDEQEDCLTFSGHRVAYTDAERLIRHALRIGSKESVSQLMTKEQWGKEQERRQPLADTNGNAMQNEPTNTQEVQGVLAAIGVAADAAASIRCAHVKYRLSMVFLLRKYDETVRSIRRAMKRRVMDRDNFPRPRGGASGAKKQALDIFALRLRHLGGPPDDKQLERARIKFRDLVRRLNRDFCDAGTEIWSDINGYEALRKGDMNELKLSGEIVRREMAKLIESLE
ncbi:hypothetical protein HDK77DRAFT_478004 [Phyllosticta capitalensis]